MNVAILGTGSVGQALAQKLLSLGHSIYIGTRNPQQTMEKQEKDAFGNPPMSFWLQDHPEVSLLEFKQAAQAGTDLIIFAMSGQHAFDCLDSIGQDILSGRIMMDISNPLDFSQGFPPSLFVSNTDSLGEQIQAAYPDTKVVKTLNTMSNPVMVNPQALEGHHTVFMSGNDAAAKKSVAALLSTFGWTEEQILDLGDISTARGTEMLLPIWLRLYGNYQTPYFNFSINANKR